MRRCFHVALAVVSVIALGSCSSGLDLTKASTQLQVGVRAARENLWREALFRFQRAVQIDPQNALAQNNLAVAYEGIGEFDKARQAYSEALRLDRSNEYIQKNYSRFVEFYSKNKKREKQLEARSEPTKTAPSEPTPAPPPTATAPPSEPTAVPATTPEPPKEPVSTPPEATKPDAPPRGGLR